MNIPNIPEEVETFFNWREQILDTTSPVNEDKFLEGFADHAEQANDLFGQAFDLVTGWR